MGEDFGGKKWEVTVQTQAEAAQEPSDGQGGRGCASESKRSGRRC